MTEEEIRALGRRVAQIELNMAVSEERYRNINENLNSIKGTLNKLAWLVISAVITAGLAVAFGGGLPFGQ